MDLFDISAKISLDTSNFEKGLEESDKKGNSFASKLGRGLGNVAKIGGQAIGAAVTATTAMVAAGTTAAIGLAKQATDSYANYEQLVGGLETMFEDLDYDVILNAENAYKTAGLSANEYMETVMGFSAALTSSLAKNEGNIARAADLSDQIIRDMSDNANKMGSSMESIQNAYSGFAKQQYNMLDNLKLGYGGTKEEMERLLSDAEALSGIEYDISNFADVAEAIHVVQTEMGITGTTAKEAAETISGSAASAKSAWENLVTALGRGEGISESIQQFAEAASTYAKNIIPVFTQALSGVSQIISELAPVLAEQLPEIANAVIPAAIEAGISIVTALASAFPELIPTVVNVLNENSEQLISAAITMISTLGSALVENLPLIADAAIQIVMGLVSSIEENGGIGEFVTAAFTLIQNLASSIAEALPELIPAAVSMVLQLVEGIIDNIDLLIDSAISLVLALVDGIMKALPMLLEKAPEIIEKLANALIRNLPKIISAAMQLIIALVKGIIQNLPQLIMMGPEIIASLISGIVSAIQDLFGSGKDMVEKVKAGFSSAVGEAASWGSDMIQNFISGITAKAQALIGKVKEVAGRIKSFLGFSEPEEGPLSDFHTYAPDMMNLFMKGINDNKRRLADTVASAFDFENLMTAPSMNMNGVPALAGAGAGVGGIGGGINLYIDGNKLVGATSQKMDRNLGDMQKIRARFGGR